MATFFFNFYVLVNGIILLDFVHSKDLEVLLLSPGEQYETKTGALTCQVYNLKEGQSIVWYKGTEQINKNDEQDRYNTFGGKYEDIDKSSEDLNIANLSRKDDGTQYTCRVYEGSKEIATSPEASLKVIAVPVWTHPHFYPQCSRLSAAVRKGDTYKVSCRTEKTEPAVRLVLKKGVHVVCNRTVSESSTSCDYKNVATSSDEKIKFTCDQIGPTNIPNYPASVTRSCNIGTLEILKPPKVEIKGKDVAKIGEEVVLICYPSESQMCVWIYEKNEYISAAESKIDNVCILRLTLHSLSPIASLNVTCRAENDMGSRSDSKIIQFMDVNSNAPVTADDKNRVNTNTKNPLWTGVIIAITGCFAIVIVLITSVILYCGWRHFIPRYSPSGLPCPDIYSEQYNRSPYRMQGIQKCVAIQVSDEIENECVDEVENKLTAADSNKQDEQHYSHICSP